MKLTILRNIILLRSSEKFKLSETTNSHLHRFVYPEVCFTEKKKVCSKTINQRFLKPSPSEETVTSCGCRVLFVRTARDGLPCILWIQTTVVM